jgi:hypothetical protein
MLSIHPAPDATAYALVAKSYFVLGSAAERLLRQVRAQ